MADFAPQRENIDDDERKVPGHQADEEGGLEEIGKSGTAEATESGEDEHHDGAEGEGKG
jgi:hypothetical protein